MPNIWSRLVLASSVSLAATAALAADRLDLRAQIDGQARPLIEDGTAVGLAIGVFRDDQSQLLAYGETVRGSGQRPTADTLYEIGSVSKVFTAALLADLVQAGVVDFDDPLQELLPAGVTIRAAEGQPITLEHLATHTSGLPRLPGNLQPINFANPYADYSVEQLYAFLDGFEPTAPPGKYEYSNLGMGLLGHVLALRQAQSYEELLVDRIARPLGLHDTRITLSAQQRRRLAPGYDEALRPVSNWDVPTLAGAGAIRSTCGDLLTFVQACLADDSDQLHRALRQTLAVRQRPANGPAMALAWQVASDGAARFHNGMTGGYHAAVGLEPKRQIGIVVLANTATMQVTDLGQRVLRIACGETVAPPERQQTVEVDRAVLERNVGYYALAPGFGLTVTRQDDALVVQASGQQALPVFAASPTEFFYKAVSARIEFLPGASSQVDELILRQAGRELRGVRQRAP